MTRPLLLTAVLTVALTASPAAGAKKGDGERSSGRAKVLRAKLAPVQQDVADYSAARGKARLTVNKRNAKVSIQLKGLVPGARHTWSVVTGGCTGTPVPGFKYRGLTARGSGNASAKGTARKGTLVLDASATYFVVVHRAGTTEALLCGQLEGKAMPAEGGRRSDDDAGRRGRGGIDDDGERRGRGRGEAEDDGEHRGRDRDRNGRR